MKGQHGGKGAAALRRREQGQMFSQLLFELRRLHVLRQQSRAIGVKAEQGSAAEQGQAYQAVFEQFAHIVAK